MTLALFLLRLASGLDF
jgi:uncharacterized protein YbbC (DUF1343 family)